MKSSFFGVCRRGRRLAMHVSSFAILGVLGLSGSQLIAQSQWSNSDLRTRSVSYASAGSSWQGSTWLGGSTAPQREWQLGLLGDNTDVGVRVRSVTPGSAASRARIEVGDSIVTVNGYQVGMVQGRLYDLSEEISRRADASGAVTLVVQDHRTSALASVRVQLDSHQQTLSGSIIVQNQIPLPEDAVVTVQIENVTRPYYQVKNGTKVFRAPHVTSTPYEIAYDPAYVDAQDVYQVRAFVTSAGRVIMDTPQPQQVLTRGNPSQVSLQLVTLGTGLASGTSPTSSTVVSAGYPNFNQIDDQIIAMYRRYLRRDPTYLELAALRATPGIVDRLQTMPLELMAAQEYFDAAGNNNRVWLESVFQEIVKRPASPAELDQWMQRYASLGYSRMALLEQLNAQAKGI